MTWNLLCQELLAFVFYFLYSSFFEWWFHKYLFHSPKLSKKSFKAHQLVHHQRYKYSKHTYEVQEGQEKEHIAMDWFALPMFTAAHMPLFVLVQVVTGWQSMWGGIAALMAYYCIYEYCHYCMHVPAHRLVERSRFFAFVKEHHRVHHKYMQQNLNVFFPLADKCMGTYRRAPELKTSGAPTLATPGIPAVIKPLHPQEQS